MKCEQPQILLSLVSTLQPDHCMDSVWKMQRKNHFVAAAAAILQAANMASLLARGKMFFRGAHSKKYFCTVCIENHTWCTIPAANLLFSVAVFGSGLPRVGNPVAARAAVAGRCSTELSMSSRRTILSSAPTTTRAITADLCPLLSSIRQLSISATNSHYAKMGIYRAQALAQKRGRPDPFEGQPKIVYGCQRNCRTSPWKLNLVAKLVHIFTISVALPCFFRLLFSNLQSRYSK